MGMTMPLALLAFALVVWPERSRIARGRFMGGRFAGSGISGSGIAGRGRIGPRAGMVAAPLAVALCGVAIGIAVSLPLAVALCLAALVGAILWRRRASSRRRRADLDALEPMLRAAMRELAAGAPPDRALLALSAKPRQWSPAARVVLRRVAALEALALRRGTPLAELLGTVATELTGDARTEAALSAELGGAILSGYLLAALPVAGLGLGVAMGADPLAVLFGGGIGGVLLIGGVGLIGAGLIWCSRLAHAVVDD